MPTRTLNALTLDELAERIRISQRAARATMANALSAALDAGDALIDAQGRVPTGGWRKWLRETCLISVSTAKLYMQLARHRAEIESEIERIGELSLRAARRLISQSRVGTPRPKSNRAEPGDALTKPTSILRKALSLIKMAYAPGVSAAMAASNQNEAVASLRQLVVLLVRDEVDLNDIVLSAAKAAPSSRRRAA